MASAADKIPKNHGEFYFDPALPLWKEEALRNREWLVKQNLWGLTAQKARMLLKLPTDQPLILSGHQPIFFHPGVWAKCLTASILAESVSGTACHKITDTAMTGEYIHTLPEVEDNGKARRKELDFFLTKDMKQQEKTTPYAHLPAPEFAALEKIFSDAQVFCPEAIKGNLRGFEEKLVKGLKKNPTWTDFHLYTLKLLDEICGTSRQYLTGSKLWTSEPFLQFAANWLSNLAEMNQAYNESLDEYRKKYGITHELSPMPNLKFENWWFEIPFWGVTKYHQRHSLYAKKDGKKLILKIKGGDGTYPLDQEDMQRQLGVLNISLWPKAIPQTLFCRMYLCDFFIHGVGGSSYEEVGDSLFKKIFKANPPAYGVVSATYLVDPEESRSMEVILLKEAKIEWWGRALAQNPEYLFTKAESWQKELPVFMLPKFKDCYNNEKLKKLASEKIQCLEGLKDPAKRPEASAKLKQVNFALYDSYTEIIKTLEQGLLDIGKLKQTKEVLGGREYPFFCFSPQTFADMKDKIRSAAHVEVEKAASGS